MRTDERFWIGEVGPLRKRRAALEIIRSAVGSGFDTFEKLSELLKPVSKEFRELPLITDSIKGNSADRYFINHPLMLEEKLYYVNKQWDRGKSFDELVRVAIEELECDVCEEIPYDELTNEGKALLERMMQ